jgi:ATP-binding cassette subfamily F protein 3
VLLDAIANFTGTVLFVSHDRYFIDGLATRVFEVEDRRVHIYPGNYEDYLYRKSGGPEKTTISLATSLKPTPAATASKPTAHPSNSNGTSGMHPQDGVESSASTDQLTTNNQQPATPTVPIKRLNPIKLKQLEDRVLAIDAELTALDTRIAAAEQHLGHYSSAVDSQRTADELESLRDQRAALLAEWESLATALEEQSTAV